MAEEAAFGWIPPCISGTVGSYSVYWGTILYITVLLFQHKLKSKQILYLQGLRKATMCQIDNGVYSYNLLWNCNQSSKNAFDCVMWPEEEKSWPDNMFDNSWISSANDDYRVQQPVWLQWLHINKKKSATELWLIVFGSTVGTRPVIWIYALLYVTTCLSIALPIEKLLPSITSRLPLPLIRFNLWMVENLAVWFPTLYKFYSLTTLRPHYLFDGLPE